MLNNKLLTFLKRQKTTSPGRSTLYFLHIPKTAGTTFAKYLRSHYGAENALTPQTWDQLHDYIQRENINKPADEYISDFHLVIGHYGYGIIRYIPHKTHIVTILREPVDRTISQLCHIKNEPTYNSWVRTRFCLPDENIEDMVDDPQRLNFFRNYQARYLAKNIDYLKLVRRSGFDGGDLLFDSSQSFSSNPEDERLFDEARKHADSFLLVGIQDYLEETMLMLAAKIGWQPPRKIPILTATTDHEQKKRLQVHHIQKIEEATAIDKKLFTYYKEKFEIEYLSLIGELTGGEPENWQEFLSKRSQINIEVRKRISTLSKEPAVESSTKNSKKSKAVKNTKSTGR